jgi:peptidoglycan/xylan/chitin deacetylase (PgdA/CDA1 family)
VRAILTYHSLDDSNSPISVSPSAFETHVSFLASGRVRVVPLAQIENMTDREDAVAITFDDGFQSFADTALPRLADHGLPSTLFVVSDVVGKTNAWNGTADAGIPVLPLMDWDAIGRARERGAEIGGHTRRHRDLTLVTDAEIVDEIAGSADAIAEATGDRPASFAYPYGKHDLRAEQAVRQTYRRACTTDLRWLSAADDPVQLPRIDMYYFRSPGQLETWGTPAFARRVWLRAQGRRVKHLAARVGVAI